MKKYLKKNKDWLTVLVSIVVGFSSILATFVNAYLVNEQNKISLIQKHCK